MSARRVRLAFRLGARHDCSTRRKILVNFDKALGVLLKDDGRDDEVDRVHTHDNCAQVAGASRTSHATAESGAERRSSLSASIVTTS